MPGSGGFCFVLLRPLLLGSEAVHGIVQVTDLQQAALKISIIEPADIPARKLGAGA